MAQSEYFDLSEKNGTERTGFTMNPRWSTGS